MTPERLILHPPGLFKRVGAALGVLEVTPADICSDGQTLAELYKKYPDLAGDNNHGPGNDGRCQSWVGHKGWWKPLVEKHQGKK